jgi:hypothetical protein
MAKADSVMTLNWYFFIITETNVILNNVNHLMPDWLL